MAKVDMHVHSKYSGRPSEWFLKKIGTNESYSEPETIFASALSNGMDYVAITDHNAIDGALLLKEKYGERVIVGIETTTYFPEDGCKIHLLVYGINRKEFEEIQNLRENIYTLRDYIKTNNLAHSIAHATYSVNKKLSIEHLEKLILLFDVFEGINGARSEKGNEIWMSSLKALTPDKIAQLKKKHNIEPFSETPWVKGFTGGSDDHAAMFIGRTYTSTAAVSSAEFIERLKKKETVADGRHNDYKTFAFILYKVLYDFSKSKSPKISGTLVSQITDLIYERKKMNFANILKFKKIRFWNNKHNLDYQITELVETVKNNNSLQVEQKLDLVFGKICDISDIMLKNFTESIKKGIEHGDVSGLIKNFSSAIPAVFMLAPFFSTLNHMNQDRELLNSLRAAFLGKKRDKPEKILWFTDTLTDLNGVSVTLMKLAGKSENTLQIVTSMKESSMKDLGEKNIINLPYIHTFDLPGYEHQKLMIPSLLRSVEILSKFQPDKIYISTPGPVGLLGLLLARLLCIKTTGIYHTDFSEQSKTILNDNEVSSIVETLVRWFYMSTDSILVPTNEYKELLAKRGYESGKMRIFARGIETDIFMPVKLPAEYLMENFGLKKGFTLLFVGRVSSDKNIDFLLETYRELRKIRENVNLLIVGDGPEYARLKIECAGEQRIKFTGRLAYELLPAVYSACDVLVFPSTIDTFGMAVLEAQSCGIPAIVTNIGGPKEIIENNKTGIVVEQLDIKMWANAINNLIIMKDLSPEMFEEVRRNSRERIIKYYSWSKGFDQFFANEEKQGARV